MSRYRIIGGSGGGGGGGGAGPENIQFDTSASLHPTSDPDCIFHFPLRGTRLDEVSGIELVNDETPADPDRNIYPVFADGKAADTVMPYWTDQNFNDHKDAIFSNAGVLSGPLSPRVTGFGPFTLCCLAYIPQASTANVGYMVTVKPNNPSGNYGLSLATRNSGIFTYVYGPGITSANAPAAATNEWHHVAMAIDGTDFVSDWNVRAYVNGVEFSNLTNRGFDTNSTADYRIHIGSFNGAINYGYRGGIQSVIGFKRALSGPEIAALSTATVGTP